MKKCVIFSYGLEFEHFYKALKNDMNSDYILILCGEKTQKSFKELGVKSGNDQNVFTVFMPVMSQLEFDSFVSQVDLNFVRGEDSFVRAVVAGKPFLWQAYKQEEEYHLEKVRAFLEILSPFMPQEFYERYSAILLGYNASIGESISFDEYSWFVENLENLEKYFKKFSEHIVKNCNLVYNLMSFISSKQI